MTSTETEKAKKERLAKGGSALNEFRKSGKEVKTKEYNLFKKFLAKKTPLKAIAAKCWVCKGGTETDGTGTGISVRVKNCENHAESPEPCPLWSLRPYVSRTAKAIPF